MQALKFLFVFDKANALKIMRYSCFAFFITFINDVLYSQLKYAYVFPSSFVLKNVNSLFVLFTTGMLPDCWMRNLETASNSGVR